MKRKIFFVVVCVAIFQWVMISSCQKNDAVELSRQKPEKDLVDQNASSERFTIIHLDSDTVYTLKSSFRRQNGEQLIVDAGTVIKCSNGSSINILPGGIIQANGTKESPVVFTSAAYPGTQQAGNWEGIIIEGKSSNNNSPGTIGDITDFSGTLNYVRIEFGSLRLKNVGSRSFFENVQVSYSKTSPAFKIEGGTFNARYLLSYASSSQADFYFTDGYIGRVQNLLAYRHPYFADEQRTLLTGLYIENNQSGDLNALPQTCPAISNMTVLGPGNQPGVLAAYGDTSFRNGALVTTGNSEFKIRNSLFMGFPAAGWYLDDLGTAQSLIVQHAELTHSIFFNSAGFRNLYLEPNTAPPLNSDDFRNFMLSPDFHNLITDNIRLEDPYNYNDPKPLPLGDSLLLKGADFSGTFFKDFFIKHNYIGALGTENWLAGWVNFTPLKTNYNFYK